MLRSLLQPPRALETRSIWLFSPCLLLARTEDTQRVLQVLRKNAKKHLLTNAFHPQNNPHHHYQAPKTAAHQSSYITAPPLNDDRAAPVIQLLCIAVLPSRSISAARLPPPPSQKKPHPGSDTLWHTLSCRAYLWGRDGWMFFFSYISRHGPHGTPGPGPHHQHPHHPPPQLRRHHSPPAGRSVPLGGTFLLEESDGVTLPADSRCAPVIGPREEEGSHGRDACIMQTGMIKNLQYLKKKTPTYLDIAACTKLWIIIKIIY